MIHADDAMRRRDVLTRLGLLGLGVGGAWWLRDHVLWPRPTLEFGAPGEWLNFVDPRANVPTVKAVVAGRPVRALIDSGAQYSVIDRALFEALNQQTASNQKGGLLKTFDMPIVAYGVGGQPQLGKGSTLDISVGQTRIPNLRTAILNLGPLAAEDGLGTPLILGQDILSNALLDIDVARRRLRLLPPHADLPANVAPLPVRRAGRALETTIEVETTPLKAVIDTGASALLALSESAAQAAGLLDGRPHAPSSSIVLGGAIASRVVEAETVTLGDRTYSRVAAAIYADVALPGFPDALVGMAAFENRRLVLDMGGGRMWLSRPLDLTVGR